TLKVLNLKISGNMDKMIMRVAVCGGKGDDLVYESKKKGAELFISGDIGYHTFLKSSELDIVIIDAGHKETEILILDEIKCYLKNKTKEKGYDIDFEVF
ncbi:MAG: Nif3-like dinuclear metal center hexameric protein, partial [Actinomycetia bacterium]|nr:Nif3-like dinuclear metal center hexameric protein [Actinomycetes bacterium]